MNLLETICENKRREVMRQKEAIPLTRLQNLLNDHKRETVSFKKALSTSSTGIISEFKRKSPSKGWIHPDANVEEIVKGYEDAGATAVSCLTDEKFFGGSFDDFKKARHIIQEIPLLRKDFIIDEYQLWQSKVLGADVILLIAACLHPDEVYRFTNIAHELGMEILLEIHNEEELEYICPDVDVVGINNRDLKTFRTDIRHTIELSRKIPETMIKISESGLSQPETVISLREEGFKGFLMGENFMKTSDPARELKNFIAQIS